MPLRLEDIFQNSRQMPRGPEIVPPDRRSFRESLERDGDLQSQQSLQIGTITTDPLNQLLPDYQNGLLQLGNLSSQTTSVVAAATRYPAIIQSSAANLSAPPTWAYVVRKANVTPAGVVTTTGADIGGILNLLEGSTGLTPLVPFAAPVPNGTVVTVDEFIGSGGLVRVFALMPPDTMQAIIQGPTVISSRRWSYTMAEAWINPSDHKTVARPGGLVVVGYNGMENANSASGSQGAGFNPDALASGTATMLPIKTGQDVLAKSVARSDGSREWRFSINNDWQPVC